MNGHGAGAALPIVFGTLLLYRNLADSKLFTEGPQAGYHTALSALGAFLLVLGLGFLFKNLK
jgi:hypothetical protein